MFTKTFLKDNSRKGAVYHFSKVLAISLVFSQVFGSTLLSANVYGATVNTATVKAKSAFVRKGSSTKNETAFCVKNGDTVAVLSEEKGDDGKTWYKVAIGDSVGFIRSDLVTKTDTKITVSDSLVTSSNKKSQDSSASTKTQETTTSSTNDTKQTTTQTTGSEKTGIVKGTYVRIRSNASTTSALVNYVNTGDIVTIVGEGKGSDGQVWYQIKKDDCTGFIRSDLLTGISYSGTSTGTSTGSNTLATASTSNTSSTSSTSNTSDATSTKEIQPGTGLVKGINVRIRDKASTEGAILKTVSTGAEITLLDKETGQDRDWYKVEITDGDKKVDGYIAASYVTVTKEVKEVITRTIAGREVSDSNKSDTEGTKDAKEASPEDIQKAATQEALKNYKSQTDITGANASIKGVGVRVRQNPVDGDVVCQLSSGHPLTINGEKEGSDGNTWYQVSFSYLGSIREGYVRSDLVTVISQTSSANAPIGSQEFEESIAALPESYKSALRSIHAAHPYWVFETVDTGLDWNDALKAESAVGKNLVSKNSIASWKSTAAQAYNWSNNTWYTFDGGSWASASTELIAYYMDPRNFLNESGIYMFEDLDYADNQSTKNVAKMLTGTFMSGNFTDADGQDINYAELFRTIGQATGVSPYLLAGRCLQEQGVSGTSQSISGNVSGYEGYFNFFNIGAYAYSGKTATINGLIYAMGSDGAYMRPWNTRAKSIYGGAKYLADKYVSKGQNTLYFQKFNVVNRENTIYSHQYMTNIQAASSESARLALAYLGDDEALHFRIPFYRNMPNEVCVKPTSDSNPNTYLSSITVDGYELTPTFSGVTENYNVTVSSDCEQVTIGAKSVSELSSVGGTGTYDIKPGANTLYVGCKAQNGSIKIYTITVNR